MQSDRDTTVWSELSRLEQLRARIDELDNLITSLIAERLSICESVKDIKEELNLPVRDEARERQVMAKVTANVPDISIRNEILSIYETILQSSRKLQSDLPKSGPGAQTKASAIGQDKDAQPSKIRAANYFPQVTIVGLGLIGGALSELIKKHSPGTRIVGVDNSAVLAKALKLKLIDRAETSLEKGLEKSALVILSAPPAENVNLLKQISPMLKRRQLVVDVTSAKRAICELAEKLDLHGADFIGGHPFFGSELSGLENASSVNAEGSLFCLIPTSASSEISLRRLVRWLTCLGLRPEIVSAEKHDRAAAVTSHLVQLVAVLLGSSLARGKSDAELADSLSVRGPAFRQMVRLIKSPPQMWSEIFELNADDVSGGAQELSKLLASAAEAIKTHDKQQLLAHFAEAKRIAALIGMDNQP
ncbi:MAG TPA: bifunctional chorismate mutase/prephenate dehydrogenase [Candidatus Obscuribacterales bacterium]